MHTYTLRIFYMYIYTQSQQAGPSHTHTKPANIRGTTTQMQSILNPIVGLTQRSSADTSTPSRSNIHTSTNLNPNIDPSSASNIDKQSPRPVKPQISTQMKQHLVEDSKHTSKGTPSSYTSIDAPIHMQAHMQPEASTSSKNVIDLTSQTFTILHYTNRLDIPDLHDTIQPIYTDISTNIPTHMQTHIQPQASTSKLYTTHNLSGLEDNPNVTGGIPTHTDTFVSTLDVDTTQTTSKLDELFLKPLAPLWYKGQPYDACEAIIDTFYSSEAEELHKVNTK